MLCGAIIKLRHNGVEGRVDLARVRKGLFSVVPQYMHPTVLRVLGENEHIPRTYSGKPIKRQILKEFFRTTDCFPADQLPEGVEYCGCEDPAREKEGPRQPWDFGGLQRAH
ncbi:hypothetical protein B0T25DRAFT_520436 [Lasiosphaeria hispida]|uniref:AMP-binding enzyme C-terminal domain-containing protein n=1 Tax=Lasiosphaeria hispida TaxID=260671 RepID=A0AAJ0HA94_9PEZI|nr:hypothetical protein B0T25DRAFT_520436 [Lasiosphaeria hispida]